MLGADVVVPEMQGLPERELEDLLGPGGEGDVARRGGLSLADDLRDLGSNGFQGDPKGLEGLGGYALPLVDQSEEDVLGADVVLVEHPRLFLGEDHDPPGAVAESLKHSVPSGPTLGPTDLRWCSMNRVLRGGRCVTPLIQCTGRHRSEADGSSTVRRLCLARRTGNPRPQGRLPHPPTGRRGQWERGPMRASIRTC